MLRVRSLGTVPYHEAYALQHALATEAVDDYLLVLQHPHTYTLGAHADERHVLVDPAEVGAVLERTDRGGDVTYHGPGQLVAYPIVTVPDDPAAGPAHVHRLEQVVVATLADLGLSGATVEDEYPGCLARCRRPRRPQDRGHRRAHLAGRPGRRRTLHGVALNVTPDLAMFGHIVPCGIADRGVTSLRAEGIDVPLARRGRRVRGAGRGRVRRRECAARRRRCRDPPTSPVRRPRGSGRCCAACAKRGWRPKRASTSGNASRNGYGCRCASARATASSGSTIHDLGLVTVCEEAGCPNIYECWADGTATFMINGERCTRACGFCQVDTRHPLPLSPDEPERVAQAVERMRLGHAVVTCVARDDLPDGGAGAMAETIRAIRSRTPETTVEVLISDCRGDAASLDAIFEARPDVLNHNIETVARLQRAVRPSAGYARSLAVLARAGQAGLVTKSGLMVGLGEREDEVVATMADLRGVGRLHRHDRAVPAPEP